MYLEFAQSASTFRIVSKPHKSFLALLYALCYLLFVAFFIFIILNISYFVSYGFFFFILFLMYGVGVLATSPMIVIMIRDNIIRNLFLSEELIWRENEVLFKKGEIIKYKIPQKEIALTKVIFKKRESWIRNNKFGATYSPTMVFILKSGKKIEIFKSICPEDIDEFYDFLKDQILLRFEAEENIDFFSKKPIKGELTFDY